MSSPARRESPLTAWPAEASGQSSLQIGERPFQRRFDAGPQLCLERRILLRWSFPNRQGLRQPEQVPRGQRTRDQPPLARLVERPGEGLGKIRIQLHRGDRRAPKLH